MNARPFFDTNVILTVFRQGDSRSRKAEALLAEGGALFDQVLNEFVAVARRKLNKNWKEVRCALGVPARLLSRAWGCYGQDAPSCLADCRALQVFDL